MDDCIEIWNNENEDAYLDPDDFSETLEAIMEKIRRYESTHHRYITQVEVMVKAVEQYHVPVLLLRECRWLEH